MHIAWNRKGLLLVACLSGLTALAVLVRLGAQGGIPLYPDSFQSMLLARALSNSVPVDPSMGVGGDPWAIPFYRMGYPLFASLLSWLSDDPLVSGLILSFVAGTVTIPLMYFLTLEGLGSRMAATGAALAMAISFSGVAWSRFVMSEALASFLIVLTFLLCVLAGRRQMRFLGIVAGLAAALMLLVRLELLVLLPTCVLFLRMNARGAQEGRASVQRDFLLALAVSIVALSVLCGWLTQNVADGFSLNPFYLLRSGFSGVAHSGDAAKLGFASGMASFVIQEPVVVLGGAVGLAVGLRRRDTRLWPLWPGLVLLVALQAPRNDIRLLAGMVPLLAYAAGVGFETTWEWAARAIREASPMRAAVLSGVFGLAAGLLLLGQLGQTEARWHPSHSYQYEIAQGVQEGVAGLALPDVIVCSYSPEVYYLVADLPARRLSAPDLSKCLSSESDDRPVLVVVDEAARQHFGDAFEEDVRSAGTLVFKIKTDAPYLEGASKFDNVLPANVYLLDNPHLRPPSPVEDGRRSHSVSSRGP